MITGDCADLWKGLMEFKHLISHDIQWVLGTSLFIRRHNLISPLAILFSEY